MKDMIFVSHATPEDNDFTYWIVSKLALLGYPVWCDLTRLLGGEVFWEDCEKAIRQRTIKFLYVLSKASNVKDGPLRELRVAHNVVRSDHIKDFIIPLWIDDLSPQQFNIEISRITAVPFNTGWEKGLTQLLKKLATDNVPKKQSFSAGSLSSWWRDYLSSRVVIKQEPEKYLSNWFEISSLPEEIHFHSYTPSQTFSLIKEPYFMFPAFRFKGYIITFSPSKDFEIPNNKGGRIAASLSYSLDDFLEKNSARRVIQSTSPRFLLNILLRIAWEKAVTEKGLTLFQMASQTNCAFFRKGLVKDDTINFDLPDRGKKSRTVVGYKTIYDHVTRRKIIRYWHFGIQARPKQWPALAYIIKPHVIFSDDGKIAWKDTRRMHAARRSQCKDWWNDSWRDRLLAAMKWLAGTSPYIEIPLGNGIFGHINNLPVIFESPVSFKDPSVSSTLEVEEELAEEELDEELNNEAGISDEQID